MSKLMSDKERHTVREKNGIVFIPVSYSGQIRYALVDSENAYLCRFNWSAPKKNRSSYPATTINGKRTTMHEMVLPKYERPLVADHINRNSFDNRLSNLHICTQRENLLNRSFSLRNRERCKYGHSLVDAYIRKGTKFCKTCNRNRSREYQRKLRAASSGLR